ncbi:MAG: glycosyl transferase [Adhaeribacter sp.]|nr:glycosyl transferase [Adhaeribacter sp.]
MAVFPLVSIIIPAYNHQDFIRQCIDSIFAQTYSNLEIIVVDDGSTDNTYKILQELRKHYSFKLLTQPNQGLVKSLIHAVTHATGKYISPLGSDDFLHPDKIAQEVAFMENNLQIAAVTCNILRVDQAGKELKDQNIPEAGSYSFNDLFLGKYYFPAPGILYRHSVYRAVGGYDPSLEIEDWSLLLKMTNAGYKIHRLKTCLAYYRIHGSNMHHAVETMAYRQLKVIRIYKYHPLYNQARSRWSAITFSSLATKQKMKALRWAANAIDFPFTTPFLKGIIKLIFTY